MTGQVIKQTQERYLSSKPLEVELMSDFPLCVRCNTPVKVSKDQYEVFERMHWLCFHLEFEHGEYDPDEPCDDPE